MKATWYIVYMIWCIFVSCLLEATDVVYDSPIYQKFILVDKNETEVLFKNELGTFKYHSSSENDSYFNSFKKIDIGQRFNTTKQYTHPTLYGLAIDNETENNIANYYDIFLGKLALCWLCTLLTLGFGVCGCLLGFILSLDGYKPSIIILIHSLWTLVLSIDAMY